MGRIYRPRTLSGAINRIREMGQQIETMERMLMEYDRQRTLLAKLASDTPQFDNPLKVIEAKKIRDAVLGGA